MDTGLKKRGRSRKGGLYISWVIAVFPRLRIKTQLLLLLLSWEKFKPDFHDKRIEIHEDTDAEEKSGICRA